VNPLKPQESKGSLEVAFFDHLRETTINHLEKNLDNIEGKEPDDAFEDAVEDDVDDLKKKIMVKLRGEVVG
jgi:hypothetical protein